MQLGFVIDHSRCIGCHACTVACKSENDVPVGSFRTWVKYTEKGEWPSVRRHFGVLRCNQCTDAPCMTICPTSALDKLANGIVDVDPRLCIGCKSCMQGCPYDALYINPDKGTAEKCHFCAHRAERGLAPACAVVCPTEAIIPGDFDDPASRVSRMKAGGDLSARKVEAGTRPNVWYREVDESAIDPGATSAAGGYLWAQQQPGAQQDAELFRAIAEQAEARTVYDVDQAPMWGWRVSTYLLTKAASAGAFVAGFATLLRDGATDGELLATVIPAIVLLLVTTALLILDLKRPERFLLILRHPNWNSWVAKGAIVLTAYGALLAAWLLPVVGGPRYEGPLLLGLGAVTCVVAVLAAVYTAWLLGQAKGRVLWLQRGLATSLGLHALVAGCAVLLTIGPPLGLASAAGLPLHVLTIAAIALYFLYGLLRPGQAPKGREAEYERAIQLLDNGPGANRHRLVHHVIGSIAPVILLLTGLDLALAGPIAGVLILIGLYVDGDHYIKTGQALTIS